MLICTTQDICDGNVLIASEYNAQLHKQVLEGRIYCIDFQTARQLPAGPGGITLPRAHQFQPPFDRMDLYPWDVYCLGKLLEQWAAVAYTGSPGNIHG
ncbi:hypothetical protein C8Q77DRAFT_1125829 [Trametes polyzona]|nr:hypothetical protein C8Q77DRAFT_1125829 [Trametes polyzona]